ncbi:MAG: hypothetical protein ACI87O_001302 [Planctomycetota bacterium]|jgi:hypothetical protein
MLSKTASIIRLQSARALSPSDLASIAQHCARLGAEDRLDLEATLRLDVQSEFDARFLAEHLAKQQWTLSAPMSEALEHWLVDEELHQMLFLQVYKAAFPARYEDLQRDLAQLGQNVVIEPLKQLMADEFEVLCLMAYDKLTTVKAYQALLPQYFLLGPRMEPLLRMVIRDEGRHYATFARILRMHHAQRLSETPAQLEKIRSNEGTPYANTFVLDHDCGIWTDFIFDRSVSQLKRALGQARDSA